MELYLRYFFLQYSTNNPIFNFGIIKTEIFSILLKNRFYNYYLKLSKASKENTKVMINNNKIINNE